MSAKIVGMKGCSSWGDCLYITACLDALKNGVVEMHKGKQEEWVSKVFDGLSGVELKDDPSQRFYLTVKDRVHSAQKALIYFGVDNLTNCIPRVLLSEKEINQGMDRVMHLKNPVVIVNDNSGCHDPLNSRAHYVRPNPYLIQDICYFLISNGFTPVQVGMSNSITELDGAHQILDLSVREYHSIFKSIGRYIGGDTGQYHAMLASGGKSIVLHPNESKFFGYEFWEMFYTDKLWKDEKSRVRYVNFSDSYSLKTLQSLVKYDW